MAKKLMPKSVREALDQAIAESKAERLTLESEPTSGQIIESDPSLRPFSFRMTAKEIHRLRVLARARGVRPSELARDLIQEGIDRAAAEPVRQDKQELDAIKEQVSTLTRMVADITVLLKPAGAKPSARRQRSNASAAADAASPRKVAGTSG